MFRQLLTPVGDSLLLSFLVAILPIAAVLTLLGVLKRAAWQAALAGLLVGLTIAIAVWHMPAPMAFSAAFNGAVFALWPVMWMVVNALLLYNIAVESGRFDAFREWLMVHLPNDRRVLLIVIGFCFGALLEGVAGFGAPVAITASLLIMCGFPALDALVFVLIFNTTPVAFGALGTPVTVLGAVTGLPAVALAQMIGRQLPFIAAVLPCYVMAVYGGWRSVRALWPMLLVAGGSFGAAQFLASNYLDYTLTDVFAALASLAATLVFLKLWRPAADAEFTIVPSGLLGARPARLPAVPAWQGWMPWLVLTATVIFWDRERRAARDSLAGARQGGVDYALSGQAVRGRLGVPAVGNRDGDSLRRARDRLVGRNAPPPAVSMRGAHPSPDLAGSGHRHADRRPRLCHELLGARVHSGSRGRLDRPCLRIVFAVLRVDRRVPIR
jgi:lactate permease